jgi:hypothetical protein
MTQDGNYEIHPVLGKAKLTPAEAEAQRDKLKADGVIRWDWDKECWIGIAADGIEVSMMSDDKSMLSYLSYYPNPTDW